VFFSNSSSRRAKIVSLLATFLLATLITSSSAFAQPVVEATATGKQDTATASHAITLPSCSVGQVLLVVFTIDGMPSNGRTLSVTSGTNWNIIGFNTNFLVSSAVYWKIAEGSDALTINIVTAKTSSHVSYCLSNATGVSAISTFGNSTNTDPPSYITGLAARNILWIAARSGDSNVSASAAPAGYSALVKIQAANSSGATTDTAYLATTSSTENPGTFTSTSEDWIAWTIAVYEDVDVVTVAKAGGTFTSGTPGSVGWSIPSNASALDNSPAIASNLNAEVSATLSATNFGFAVPSGAVIDGIELLVVRNFQTGSGAGSVLDNNIQLLLSGSNVGSNYSALFGNTYWSKGGATSGFFSAYYGNGADKWGTTWSVADINDPTFGVSIQAFEEDGDDRDTRIDYIELSVRYLVEPASGPHPTIASSAGSATNTSPIPITIEFDEAVVNFAVGDLTVGNGTAGNFVAVDGDSYTADITPTGEGLVTVDIDAAVADNGLGDDNLAATQFSIDYDLTDPAVTISSGESDPTKNSPFSVTIQFDETVTGFVVGDISVGNGSVGNFVAVDGDTYTADITPSGQGTVTVDVAGSVAQDTAGNDNTAATQFSIAYDSVAPTVTISSGESDPTSNTPFSATFQFSEVVTGFVVGDITVGNGSAGNFVAVDGDTYTADITPSGQGLVTVDVGGLVAQDSATNGNTAATQFSLVFDSNDPTVSISSGEGSATNSSPFSVTIQFNEVVAGFIVGDITVGNGSAGNFVAVDGDTYTADITPGGQGAVTVDVAGSVAQDTAGNNNTAATQFSINYDTTDPTVAISSAEGDPTSNTPFTVTIQFNEVVTGFVVGEITVGNGSAGNFVAVDGDTYTSDITPSGQGAVTVDVSGSVAQDAAGNNNSVAAQFSIVFDSAVPTVTISSGESDPTANSPFSVTFEFSEIVTGFVVGDITVGNGSAGNFVAVDGDTYTVDITPSGQGAVTVDVGGSVAQDSAANNNTAATQFSIVYDTADPTVTISSGESDPTNNSPFSLTVQFNEVVTGFVVGDITVGNGSAGNFVAVDGDTYTADITPSGQGAVTVDVAGSVAQDAAGNSNTVATQFSIVYDSVVPTVAITSGEADPTSNSPFSVTVQFSESVTGFVVGDITVGNGSAGNFVAVDGDTYTAEITPSGQGAVTVDVAGSVAQDSAGNNNTAAAQFSIAYDSVVPTVAISTGDSDPTNNSPFSVTFQFSEVVTGFVVGDITVGNGSAGNFAAVDGDTYTADITPSGQGAVTVDVGGSVAQDTAGNNNTAATQLSITFDSANPTVAISSGESDPTNNSPFSVTIQFSEVVTGFAVGDVTVGNGSAGNFVAVDGDTYTADITPSGQGAVTVDVGGSVAQDAAGNNNNAATQFSIVYDSVDPTVAISSGEGVATSNSPFSVTFQFSEVVTGFVVGDITVGNGSAGNFVAVDGDTYTADITPTGQGAVTVDVGGSVAQDAAGNNNTAATQFNITYDTADPTVAISSGESDPTNNSPFSVTIQFNEVVTGFVVGDITVGNGSAGSFVAVDGDTYTADITPAGQGAVTVDIGSSVAQDSAGNNNTAATQFSIVYDSVVPTVAVSSGESDPTSNSPFSVTIQFSEVVTGLVVGDITVGNGSAGNFVAVDGDTYTADITPAGQGAVTVDVGGSVAQDAAGNNNNAAPQFGIVYDSVVPTVAISSGEADPTSNSPFSVTIQFSEVVSGFVVGDISVGNGSAGNFVAVDGDTYTADITPSGQGAVTVDVGGSVAQDSSGNNNTAATQFSIVFDSVDPTVAISSAEGSATNNSPFSVTIQFNEVVTGFVVGDITVGNGSAGNFVAVDGDTYTADITPTGQGAITIDVAGATAQDAAGNDNTAATQFSIVYDSVVPTVVISSGEADPTNNTPFSVTVQFSEVVTSFVVGDITVGNGSAGNFIAVDGDTYTADITPSGQGAVTVDVGGSVAQDAAGNNNTAATQFSVVFDSANPTVAISSGEGSTTSNSPFLVTFQFSEVVTGFIVGDITVGNGSAGNFVAVDGDTYTAEITPAGQGAATIDVAGSVAQDAAGNNNTAATQLSINYDTVDPAVTLSSGEVDPTSNSPISITVQFTEVVTGFVVGDITVGNGSAANFVAVDGDTYTVEITPTVSGAVTVDIGGSVAQDAAGNNNTAAAQFSIVYSNPPPSVIVSSATDSVTNATPIPVTFEFTEDVTGFVVGELVVANGNASNFVAVDGNSYTVDITPVADGVVTVSVPVGAAQDADTNDNLASALLTRTFDSTVPTVVVSTQVTSPTTTSPISITIQFSEAVTEFIGSDITVTNATVSNFVAVDGDTYTARITPIAAGVVTAKVAAIVAKDGALNSNSLSNTLSLVYSIAASGGSNLDSDGDGVTDGQESTDETDPADSGSFLSVLNTSFCSEWNGFLGGMYNVMEFVNLSSSNRTVRTTLYSFEGVAMSNTTFSVAPGVQQDLLVHDMTGWIPNSYGKVCSAILNGAAGDVDGRMSYYKPNAAGAFDFAFAMPYQNGLRGSQFVMFNTYQPSLDGSDSENVVTNWIQLTNLEESTNSGTLHYYGQDGVELRSEAIVLPAGARRDFSGHQFGSNLVGMIEWRPSSATAKFSLRNVRYFYDNKNLREEFDAAFQLEGAKGNGSELVVPLDTRTGSAILEVANTLSSEVAATVKIYSEQGLKLEQYNFTLPARGSVHIITDSILNSTLGSATIDGSRKQSLIATAMHYGRTSTSGISYLYGINATEALGAVIRGSYNTFLNQGCELLLVNAKNLESTITVGMTRYDGTEVLSGHEINLPARSSSTLDACGFENQAAYGVITVQPQQQNSVTATVIRSGPDGAYRFPTPVRQ
jgi:hypothetical protein